jgi:hypothetical protein
MILLAKIKFGMKQTAELTLHYIINNLGLLEA